MFSSLYSTRCRWNGRLSVVLRRCVFNACSELSHVMDAVRGLDTDMLSIELTLGVESEAGSAMPPRTLSTMAEGAEGTTESDVCGSTGVKPLRRM
jgi:hypothetical protein